MRLWWVLSLFLAFQIFGFQNGTMFHNDCKEQNDIQKGKFGNCRTQLDVQLDYGEVQLSEIKQ